MMAQCLKRTQKSACMVLLASSFHDIEHECRIKAMISDTKLLCPKTVQLHQALLKVEKVHHSTTTPDMHSGKFHADACLMGNEGFAILRLERSWSFAAVCKLALPSCCLRQLMPRAAGVPAVCMVVLAWLVPEAAVDEGEQTRVTCCNLVLILRIPVLLFAGSALAGKFSATKFVLLVLLLLAVTCSVL